MVDQEKLAEYAKKYEEVKEGVVEASIIKGDLERQQVKSDSRLRKLSNDITDEKASVWFEKAHQLRQKADYLKKKFKINITMTALIVILMISLGYFVAELPLSLVSIAAAVVSVVKTGYDIKKYNKNIKKCSITNIKDSELKSINITKLTEDHSKEMTRNVEIRKSIDVVDKRLSDLAIVKLDIENLIICLFSSLDNIIKNKSDEYNPFATWLNINYDEDEIQLEISDEMKRTLNKKEEK